MATIAVLGMGLLGRGFAENALTKGHTVHVWNRTASKCAPVVEQGAIQADTPADAVRDADRVHLILSEDKAVDAVIAAFADALPEGTPVVDHSTTLPAATRARFDRLRADGIRYLHAPVFMGPSNSRAATGLMLVCGPADEVAALKPTLETMTGRVMVLGTEPDHAAAVKLTGNGMLISLTATMGDLFKLGQANGLAPADTIALFEAFSPTPAGMGKRVLASKDGTVGFELKMARKDIRLMIEAAGGPESLAVLPGIAAAMDAALANGRGNEDFTAFVRPEED